MTGLDLETVSESFLRFCWLNLPRRDRAKVMAGSPRTLWLFGAGASHHYDLNARGVPVPLAAGFFEAFNELPTSQGFHAHVGPFISFLGHYRGVQAQDVPLWRENIEDFMTSIEAEISRVRAKKAEGDFGTDDFAKGLSFASVFNNLGFILASVVNEAQNGPSETLYRYLLDFCGPDDAFVTFNWDTLLDRALVDTGGWSPNDGYGLSFASVLDGTWKARVEGTPEFSTNWRLLKLHGSTNWLVPSMHVSLETFEYVSLVPHSDRVFLYWQSGLPYGTHKGRWRGGYVSTCYCYYPPNIPGSYFSKGEISAEPGHVFVRLTPKGVFAPFDEPDRDGIPASAVLITPVRQKKYEAYQTAINSLWTHAANSLSGSDKIVIIGYSFPPTDTRALELLGNALAARTGKIAVEVVAPDASAIVLRIGEERLRNAKTVTAHNVRFEDYLGILATDIPALMKRAAATYNEVREWVERIYALGQITVARQQSAVEPGEAGR
jgi:hypothetical protein